MEVFYCLVPECKATFKTKLELQNHYAKQHSEASVTKAKEETVRSLIPEDYIKRIVPDVEFLTQNTTDLKEMLEGLPEGVVYTDEETFQQDFDEILNEKVEHEEANTLGRFRCDKCKFKVFSQRALRAHVKLVHDTTFFACKKCRARTKTTGAMELHLRRKHNTIVKHDDSEKSANLRKEEKSMENNTEPEELSSNDSSLECSDTEYDDEVPDLYREKKWKNGYNFKLRTQPFEKAVANLKTLLKKSAKSTNVGDLTIRVLDVEKHGGGKLAKIELTDKEGTGEVKLQFWGCRHECPCYPCRFK